MKYIIHTINKRKWYVNKFLIPSMLEQGIAKENIIVAVDTYLEGNLISCMKVFDWIGRSEDWNNGIWHLQDDIIISKTFKERTEKLYGDIICGFCSNYDKSLKTGLVKRYDMWYSFPCIYINNRIAKDCASWFFNNAVFDVRYKAMIDSKKHDDEMFRIFLEKEYPNVKAFNVSPNLVDHIDYLIGGSVVNPQRIEGIVKSRFWSENSLITELSKVLTK